MPKSWSKQICQLLVSSHVPSNSKVVMPKQYHFARPIESRGTLFNLSITLYEMHGGGLVVKISAMPWTWSNPTGKRSSSALCWYSIGQTIHICSWMEIATGLEAVFFLIYILSGVSWVFWFVKDVPLLRSYLKPTTSNRTYNKKVVTKWHIGKGGTPGLGSTFVKHSQSHPWNLRPEVKCCGMWASRMSVALQIAMGMPKMGEKKIIKICR